MHGGRILAVYDTVLSGFAIEMPEAAAEALARNPQVRFVEENAVVRAASVTSASQDTDGVPGNPEYGLWHLDRSDQRQVDAGGLDGTYGYCSTGDGVYAYILDTGIWASHPEFGGRVLEGPDFSDAVGTASNPCRGPASYPPEKGGHGTAVASVLAGETYGVAKSAKLVPIRVLNCVADGTNAWVLDGLKWILKTPQTSDINSGNPYLGMGRGVVNMSFYYPQGSSESLHDAVQQLVTAGFAVFASANNFPEESACARGPAADGTVITVGGTMLGPNMDRDQRWVTGSGIDQGSSYGPCVDIWAPAHGIKVAEYRSGELIDFGPETHPAFKMSSGTSYSSPLVAGIAARVLQYEGGLSPAELRARLIEYSTKEDTTGLTLIWEPVQSRSASETIPNNRLVYRKDYIDVTCRSRPVRPVSITAQPASWTLPSGSQTTLIVQTDQPAEFQWYRGVSGDMSQPVWGSKTAAFTTPPLNATTSYWVRVEGEANVVNSNTATITLGACPAITGSLSPSMTTIVSGQSLTLTVSASSINPLTYEWYKDDFYGQAQIPNANTNSITVSPVGFTRYTAVLKNGCRTFATNTAHVYVATEHSIALATYYWNFVGADGGGGSGVHATASYPYEYERFVLRDLNGGDLVDGDQVTLRSYNGHYVVAEWCGGPGQTVNANRTTAGDWETFSIQNMDGGYVIGHGSRIALRACSGAGYYVVAEYGGLNGGGPGAGDVNCDRSAAGEWETFQILWQ